MIYREKGRYSMEEREPVLRSCWECNPSHEHLKNVNRLHLCFGCGRYWIYGCFLDSFDSKNDMDDFLEKKLKHAEKE